MRAFTYMEIIWLIAFQIHTHFILWHGKWLSIVRKRSWTSFFEHDHLIFKVAELFFICVLPLRFRSFCLGLESKLDWSKQPKLVLIYHFRTRFDSTQMTTNWTNAFFCNSQWNRPLLVTIFFSLIIHKITGNLLIWHINAVKNGMQCILCTICNIHFRNLCIPQIVLKKCVKKQLHS